MKKKKVLFFGAGVLVVLLVLVLLSSSVLVTRKVDDLLKTQVRNALGDGWTFGYEKIKLKVVKGVLMIDELYLSRGENSETYWEFKVSSIKMYGFQVREYLTTGRLAIDSLTVDDPYLEVYSFAPKDTANERPKTKSDSMDLLHLRVQKIRTSGGNVSYDPEGPMQLSAGLEFLMTHVIIDGSNNELVQIDKGSVLIPDLYFQFPDSIYVVRVDSVKVLYGDTLFAGFGMHLESNLGKIAYGHHYGWKKARWSIDVPTWYLEAPRDIDTNKLHLSRLWLNDLDAAVFKDGRLPFSDRVKKYPQEMLEALKLKLRLDEVIVTNGNLVVEELHGERVQPALIELKDLNARLIGLQNENLSEPMMVLEGSTQLQGEAPVSIRAEYFYGNNHPYSLIGKMEPVDLKMIRRFMERSGSISIKTGVLNSLAFDLKGDKDTTFGFVDFHYSNLEVQLIDRNTGDYMGGLINFFTASFGGMFYHKNNPSGKYGYHRGIVRVQNNPYKAFVGHWVEGLLDGLMHSVLRSKTKKEDRAYRKEVKSEENATKEKQKSSEIKSNSSSTGLNLFKKKMKLVPDE